jgi:hypothetical protein
MFFRFFFAEPRFAASPAREPLSAFTRAGDTASRLRERIVRSGGGLFGDRLEWDRRDEAPV